MSKYQAGDRVRVLKTIQHDGTSGAPGEYREVSIKRYIGIVGNLCGPTSDAEVYSYDFNGEEWLVLGRHIVGKVEPKPVSVSAIPGQTVIINVSGREPIRVEVKQ